jgi:serine/threonine-protein kinase
MTDLRAQLRSALGDAYTIERELGGGGMSRVFVATERALSRQVVIKVLPHEAAGAVSVARFQREIAVAARLQQANIVPVLTAGDMGGVPYFTMPFVEGQSLRARLAAGGELPIPEAIGILKEVARALTYAHSQGIVHRDIKPDNVLLSGGTAMVTDFGVAKALSAATTQGAESLTATGLAIGTPAYMAPEQATGDPRTDHRADIYAFGCLAYELLAGSPPFVGRPAHAMIAAHASESPDPVERRRPAVPWQAATLVNRCLAKNPADRPQNASELIASLDQAVLTPTTPHVMRAAPTQRSRAPVLIAAMTVVVVGAGLLLWPIMRPPRAATTSLAVLPFANSTEDTANVFLAEGLSDELRVMLASVPGLSVKARGASVALGSKGAREAGAQLDVDAVLQGTLTPSVTRPKVVAELVRTSDETVLWTGLIDLGSTAADTGRVSLVRAISAALRGGSASATVTMVASRGTSSDSAYTEFLRGESFRRKFNITKSIPHLAHAIELDRNFARAHASLAMAYATLPLMGSAIGAEALPKANASADLALSLSPESSEARLAKGLMLFMGELRMTEAEAAIRRAVELDPRNTEALL